MSIIKKKSLPFRILTIHVIAVFIISMLPVQAFAQWQPAQLPPVGTMINPSPGFNPLLIRGLKVDPANPFVFDFLIEPGDQNLVGEELKEESTRLIKYFLASLTVPEKDLWVNLSPYEKNRIISEQFGQTDMGRELLAQDYLLKQLTASLTHPDSEAGERFWDTIRAKTDIQDIPVNVFNKVWIVPAQAEVFEGDGAAFVVESRLKVMLEADYLAMQNSVQSSVFSVQLENTEHRTPNTEVLREIIIPQIEHEVNNGEHFAPLRQIYHSLILASWYKRKLKNSILADVYVDQNKTKGVTHDEEQAAERIYNQYLDSFKKGTYDFIEEEYDPVTQQVVPHKYFSGGLTMALDNASLTVVDKNNPTLYERMAQKVKQMALAGLLVVNTNCGVPEKDTSNEFTTGIQDDVEAVQDVLFAPQPEFIIEPYSEADREEIQLYIDSLKSGFDVFSLDMEGQEKAGQLEFGLGFADFYDQLQEKANEHLNQTGTVSIDYVIETAEELLKQNERRISFSKMVANFFTGAWSDYMLAGINQNGDLPSLEQRLLSQANQISPQLAQLMQSLTSKLSQMSDTSDALDQDILEEVNDFNETFLISQGYYLKFSIKRNVNGAKTYFGQTYEVERQESRNVNGESVLTVYARAIHYFNQIDFTMAHSVHGKRVVFIDLDIFEESKREIDEMRSGRPYILNQRAQAHAPGVTRVMMDIFQDMTDAEVDVYLARVLRGHEYTHQAQDMLDVHYKGTDRFGMGELWDIQEDNTKRSIDHETVATLGEAITAGDPRSVLADMLSTLLMGEGSAYYFGYRWIYNKLDGRDNVSEWTDFNDAQGLVEQFLRISEKENLREELKRLIDENWSEQLRKSIEEFDAAKLNITGAQYRYDKLITITGDPVFAGSEGYVFTHPDDATKLVKVYDPEVMGIDGNITQEHMDAYRYIYELLKRDSFLKDQIIDMEFVRVNVNGVSKWGIVTENMDNGEFDNLLFFNDMYGGDLKKRASKVLDRIDELSISQIGVALADRHGDLNVINGQTVFIDNEDFSNFFGAFDRQEDVINVDPIGMKLLVKYLNQTQAARVDNSVLDPQTAEYWQEIINSFVRTVAIYEEKSNGELEFLPTGLDSVHKIYLGSVEVGNFKFSVNHVIDDLIVIEQAFELQPEFRGQGISTQFLDEFKYYFEGEYSDKSVVIVSDVYNLPSLLQMTVALPETHQRSVQNLIDKYREELGENFEKDIAGNLEDYEEDILNLRRNIIDAYREGVQISAEVLREVKNVRRVLHFSNEVRMRMEDDDILLIAAWRNPPPPAENEYIIASESDASSMQFIEKLRAQRQVHRALNHKLFAGDYTLEETKQDGKYRIKYGSDNVGTYGFIVQSVNQDDVVVEQELLIDAMSHRGKGIMGDIIQNLRTEFPMRTLIVRENVFSVPTLVQLADMMPQNQMDRQIATLIRKYKDLLGEDLTKDLSLERFLEESDDMTRLRWFVMKNIDFYKANIERVRQTKSAKRLQGFSDDIAIEVIDKEFYLIATRPPITDASILLQQYDLEGITPLRLTLQRWQDVIDVMLGGIKLKSPDESKVYTITYNHHNKRFYIMDGGKEVGHFFFTVKDRWKNEFHIAQVFSINRDYQGEGISTRVLEQVKSFFDRYTPDINVTIVSVVWNLPTLLQMTMGLDSVYRRNVATIIAKYQNLFGEDFKGDDVEGGFLSNGKMPDVERLRQNIIFAYAEGQRIDPDIVRATKNAQRLKYFSNNLRLHVSDRDKILLLSSRFPVDPSKDEYVISRADASSLLKQYNAESITPLTLSLQKWQDVIDGMLGNMPVASSDGSTFTFTYDDSHQRFNIIDGEKPVGYFHFAVNNHSEKELLIAQIFYINNEYQGQGISTRILEQVKLFFEENTPNMNVTIVSFVENLPTLLQMTLGLGSTYQSNVDYIIDEFRLLLGYDFKNGDIAGRGRLAYVQKLADNIIRAYREGRRIDPGIVRATKNAQRLKYFSENIRLQVSSQNRILLLSSRFPVDPLKNEYVISGADSASLNRREFLKRFAGAVALHVAGTGALAYLGYEIKNALFPTYSNADFENISFDRIAALYTDELREETEQLRQSMRQAAGELIDVTDEAERQRIVDRNFAWAMQGPYKNKEELAQIFYRLMNADTFSLEYGEQLAILNSYLLQGGRVLTRPHDWSQQEFFNVYAVTTPTRHFLQRIVIGNKSIYFMAGKYAAEEGAPRLGFSQYFGRDVIGVMDVDKIRQVTAGLYQYKSGDYISVENSSVWSYLKEIDTYDPSDPGGSALFERLLSMARRYYKRSLDNVSEEEAELKLLRNVANNEFSHMFNKSVGLFSYDIAAQREQDELSSNLSTLAGNGTDPFLFFAMLIEWIMEKNAYGMAGSQTLDIVYSEALRKGLIEGRPLSGAQIEGRDVQSHRRQLDIHLEQLEALLTLSSKDIQQITIDAYKEIFGFTPLSSRMIFERDGFKEADAAALVEVDSSRLRGSFRERINKFAATGLLAANLLLPQDLEGQTAEQGPPVSQDVIAAQLGDMQVIDQIAQTRIVGDQNIDRLMGYLNHENPAIRMNAVQALADVGYARPDVVTVLRALLNDSDEGVRGQAIETLGDIVIEPTDQLIEEIFALSTDDDLRWEVMNALDRMGQGNQLALEKLVDLAQYRGPNFSLSSDLQDFYVGDIDATKALEILIEHLKSNPDVFRLGDWHLVVNNIGANNPLTVTFLEEFVKHNSYDADDIRSLIEWHKFMNDPTIPEQDQGYEVNVESVEVSPMIINDIDVLVDSSGREIYLSDNSVSVGSEANADPFFSVFQFANSNVLTLSFNHYWDQKSLDRIGLFVEHPEVAGQILPLSIMPHFYNKIGRSHLYDGHDYHGDNLAEFFNLAKRENHKLSDREKRFRDFLMSEPLKLFYTNANGDYEAQEGLVVTSFSRDIDDNLKDDVLRHEVYSHAMYMSNPDYAKEVRNVYESLTMQQQGLVKAFLALQGYDIEDNEELLLMEFAAYFQDPQTLVEILDRKYTANIGKRYYGTALQREAWRLFKSQYEQDAHAFMFKGTVSAQLNNQVLGMLETIGENLDQLGEDMRTGAYYQGEPKSYAFEQKPFVSIGSDEVNMVEAEPQSSLVSNVNRVVGGVPIIRTYGFQKDNVARSDILNSTDLFLSEVGVKQMLLDTVDRMGIADGFTVGAWGQQYYVVATDAKTGEMVLSEEAFSVIKEDANSWARQGRSLRVVGVDADGNQQEVEEDPNFLENYMMDFLVDNARSAWGLYLKDFDFLEADRDGVVRETEAERARNQSPAKEEFRQRIRSDKQFKRGLYTYSMENWMPWIERVLNVYHQGDFRFSMSEEGAAFDAVQWDILTELWDQNADVDDMYTRMGDTIFDYFKHMGTQSRYLITDEFHRDFLKSEYDQTQIAPPDRYLKRLTDYFRENGTRVGFKAEIVTDPQNSNSPDTIIRSFEGEGITFDEEGFLIREVDQSGLSHPSFDEMFDVIRRVTPNAPVLQKDLGYVRTFVEAIDDLPIKNVAIVGMGMPGLPIALSMMGKNVTVIEASPEYADNWERGTRDKLNIIRPSLEAAGYTSGQVRFINSEFGILNGEENGLEGQFDLVTMVDLIGGNPKGDPREWMQAAERMLRPQGYLLFDERYYELDGQEDSMVNIVGQIFASTERPIGDQYFTSVFDAYRGSLNRLHRVTKKSVQNDQVGVAGGSGLGSTQQQQVTPEEILSAIDADQFDFDWDLRLFRFDQDQFAAEYIGEGGYNQIFRVGKYAMRISKSSDLRNATGGFKVMATINRGPAFHGITVTNDGYLILLVDFIEQSENVSNMGRDPFATSEREVAVNDLIDDLVKNRIYVRDVFNSGNIKFVDGEQSGVLRAMVPDSELAIRVYDEDVSDSDLYDRYIQAYKRQRSRSLLFGNNRITQHLQEKSAELKAMEKEAVVDASGLDESQATPVGGIDLNPANWELKMRGQGGTDCRSGDTEGCLRFDITPEQLERLRLQIDGLVPVIINIHPVQNLPLFLGMTDESPGAEPGFDMARDAYFTKPESVYTR